MGSRRHYGLDWLRIAAFALLIGPLAFGRVSTLADFDYRAVAAAAQETRGHRRQGRRLRDRLQ